VVSRLEDFWAAIESRHQPFGTTAILEDSRFAARLPVFAGYGSALNAFAIGVFVFTQGEVGAGWLALITAAAYAVATVYYVLSGNAERTTGILLWTSLANNIGVHVLLGGFAWSGVSLGWGVLITSASALFLSRRSTLLIGGAYLVAAVVLFYFEARLRAGRPEPPVIVSTVLAMDMFIVSLLLIAPIASLLVDQIAREQSRTNSLLLNVLPGVVAKRLKQSPGVIADEFDECTVLFADIVGFTTHTHGVSPERLVEELNHVFSRFDALAQTHGVEKIKTIGDGYMAVAGVPVPHPRHVESICDLALAMSEEIPAINETLGTDFQVRIGVNTGSVVAGVIGTSRFSYDLWGDTVNVASRMESQGTAGKIQVTEAVVDHVGSGFLFEAAGTLDIRGRGEMPVYVLVGRRPGASIADIGTRRRGSQPGDS
jgi:class 3 adenylate cyclase